MCGIAGIIGPTSLFNQLPKMLQEQAYRGPDNTGVWSDEYICLGHNRLSIIDLSDAANQPMTDPSGRYVMVFNGEIYNYKELSNKHFVNRAFSSNGDSEVLLALYLKLGVDMLDELIGMFAFAIWDKERRSLFAARDRFGVKPFYYSLNSDTLVFASELKTLWCAGIERSPRPDVWASYFGAGSYGMPADTFWTDIYQLPAGHWLEYSVENGLHIQQWYHFIEAVEKQTIYQQESELHDAYLSLLKDAVAIRFRADVPVGFTLSGGLDSSLLLSAIHHLFPGNDSIKAFTFYSDHEQYNELPWAEMLAARASKPIDPVLLTAKNIEDFAERMAWLQGEPFGGIPTIAYYQVFAAAKKQGFKVLLDGQGMDEAWAGYDYYFSGKNHLVQGSVASPLSSSVLEEGFAGLQQKLAFDKPFESRLKNLQYRDLFFTKLPRALRFNDRASMIASVELREPFLDHRLVEMAFAQSDEMKQQHGQPKWMLRKIAAEWLGDQLAYAPKRAVQTPQREWLKNELRDWADDQINWLATTGNPGWFDGKEMQKEWNNYVDGRGDNSFFVWQWTNTALLLKKSTAWMR